MKLNLIIGALLVVCTPGAASDAKKGDAVSRARELFNFVRAHKYDKFVNASDAVLAETMPPEMLSATWSHLEKKIGSFEKELDATAEEVPGGTLVTLRCQFAKDTLNVTMLIDAQHRARSLTFTPTAQASSYTAPPYVDRAAFTEKQVVVTAGRFDLPGTLTVPKRPDKYPGVVLVHGSGPQDRDETIFQAKPFKDLAWGLGSRGIAVLRYDKRTKVHPVAIGTTAPDVDMEIAEDAIAAAQLLLNSDAAQVGQVFVLGHSLGATAAPYIASRSTDISGIIMLAAAARPIHELIPEQIRYLSSLDGTVDQQEQLFLDEVSRMVQAITDGTTQADDKLLGVPVAYWKGLDRLDIANTARSLSMPMLFLQGKRDYQVSATEDFGKLRNALQHKQNATFKLFDRMDHLFQAGDQPSRPDDYQKRGHVDGQVIEYIATWINKHKS